MNSKKLSQLTNIPISTIRYYESIGHLPSPKRSENNYRQYEDKHAQILQSIRFLTYLDFPLAEVRAFYQAIQNHQVDTNYLMERLTKKENDIHLQLKKLEQLHKKIIVLTQNTNDLLEELKNFGEFLQ